MKKMKTRRLGHQDIHLYCHVMFMIWIAHLSVYSVPKDSSVRYTVAMSHIYVTWILGVLNSVLFQHQLN